MGPVDDVDVALMTMTKSEQIKTELLAIKAASPDRMLHVKNAEQWARRHPKSALYSVLEWDEAKAAQQFRYWQIRSMIELHVRSADDRPMLISLMPDRINGGGYRDIADVGSNQRLARLAEEEVERELIRFLRKYAHVKKFMRLWKLIEQLVPKEEQEQRKAS